MRASTRPGTPVPPAVAHTGAGQSHRRDIERAARAMSPLPGVVRLLFIVCALAASGCAPKMVAPPSDELRADLATLGLVTPSRHALNEPDQPVKGTASAAVSGAGQGAAGTFLGTARVFCEGSDPVACSVGIVLGAVLAPVGAVIGAGIGASRSHSAEEVERAHEVLIAVVGEARPNAELATRFAERAEAAHGTAIVPVKCRGAMHVCTHESDGAPKYALRLAYSRFLIEASGEIEPDLAVAATVEATIFDMAGGQAVYDRSWGYKSKSHSFFDLAADGGAGLREMIESAHGAVADAIARDLLVARAPSPIGPPSTDKVWTISGPLTGENPPEADDSPAKDPGEDAEAEPEAGAGADADLPEGRMMAHHLSR